ncbi:18580_t:CDS:1, partial [Funneliformis geosporum]
GIISRLLRWQEKYFGISHKDVVNFRPNNLFMRGIDTVKQGNSELFRFIGEKIMWEAMGINNTCSIRKIVEDALWDARFKQWDFNQFVAMSKWKAKGSLACNKIFIERMRERIASGEKNIKIPDSGEQFNYVVVNNGLRYKEDGTKSTRKGDYM